MTRPDLQTQPAPQIQTTPLVNPSVYRRHPLGLPAGSVRSVLALLVFGTYWAILLMPEPKAPPVPVYLYYVMFLIVGHYFASQSRPAVDATQAAPLHLPRGAIRLLVFLGFVGVLAYGFAHDPDFLDCLRPDTQALIDQPLAPLFVLGGFFLGIVAARFAYHVLGRSNAVPSWVQDVQAWVSLLAVLGMLAEVLIRLVINPHLDPEQRVSLPAWETSLAAIVAFYFGARS